MEDIAQIIKQVDDKSRLGVCVDTCHAFAAGYDLRTETVYEEFMSKFEKVIGLEYLCAMHLNDSKAPLGAKRDLHANIGEGFIGLEGFRNLVNDKRMEEKPLILETPLGKEEDKRVWAEEITLLYWLIGRKANDEEVLKKSKELQKRGESSRKAQMEAYEKKTKKEAGKKEAGKKDDKQRKISFT